MRHVKWIMPLVIVALLAGCGGGKDTGPAETSQEAARRWLEAAINNDQAALKEMSYDESEANLLNVAAKVNKQITSDVKISWKSTFTDKGQGWMAVYDGSMLTFMFKEVGEKDFQVVDVMMSD